MKCIFWFPHGWMYLTSKFLFLRVTHFWFTNSLLLYIERLRTIICFVCLKHKIIKYDSINNMNHACHRIFQNSYSFSISMGCPFFPSPHQVGEQIAFRINFLSDAHSFLTDLIFRCNSFSFLQVFPSSPCTFYFSRHSRNKNLRGLYPVTLVAIHF